MSSLNQAKWVGSGAGVLFLLVLSIVVAVLGRQHTLNSLLLQQKSVDSVFLQTELGSSKGSNEELLSQIDDRKGRIIQTTETCENKIIDAQKHKKMEFDAVQSELEFELGVTKHYANLKNLLKGSIRILEEEQQKSVEAVI